MFSNNKTCGQSIRQCNSPKTLPEWHGWWRVIIVGTIIVTQLVFCCWSRNFFPICSFLLLIVIFLHVLIKHPILLQKLGHLHYGNYYYFFLQGCKSRGIGLCGALAAAGFIAARSSKNLPDDQWEKYAVVTLIDCRPILDPVLSSHDIGMALSSFPDHPSVTFQQFFVLFLGVL